jgi:hypothetical protein
MNLGFAGLIVGSVVTLVGTVVVPWIRDEVTRSRTKRDAQRLELRQAISAMLESMTTFVRYPELTDREITLQHISELGLLLEAKDDVLEDIAISVQAMTLEDRKAGVRAFSVFRTLIAQWFRGTLDSKDFRQTYGYHLAARGQMDAAKEAAAEADAQPSEEGKIDQA